MREFQAKKRVRRLIYSKGVIALMVIGFLFLANATWGVYKKERDTAANVAQAQLELAKLQDRETLLDREIRRLQTEDGIEAEIRSKYSVSKPGENVLILVDDATTTPEQATTTKSWWGKLKGIFTND